MPNLGSFTSWEELGKWLSTGEEPTYRPIGSNKPSDIPKPGHPLERKPGAGSIPIQKPKNRFPRIAEPLGLDGQRRRPNNYLAPTRKDVLEAERKADLLAPNTNETATKSNPWSIQSLQDKGVIQTNLSKEQIKEAEAQSTIFDEDTTSKVSKIPKESNVVKSGRTQAQGKGSVARNKGLLADMRAEQTSAPSVLTEDPSNPIVDTKKINKGIEKLGKMDLKLEGLDKASATRIGNMQNFWNNSSPKMIEFMKNNPKAAEDLLRDAGKGVGSGSGAGGGIGVAGGLKIVSMLAGLANKKKQETGASEQYRGGSIDQVAVAANPNLDDYATLPMG